MFGSSHGFVRVRARTLRRAVGKGGCSWIWIWTRPERARSAGTCALRGRTHSRARALSPGGRVASRVGESAADPLTLQHLHQYRTTARPDQPAERFEHLCGAVSRGDRLSLLCRAAGREHIFLGVVRRSPRRYQEGSTARCSPRAATGGSRAMSHYSRFRFSRRVLLVGSIGISLSVAFGT